MVKLGDYKAQVNTSGLGAGKLFLKVSTTETAANLISFITDSSGNNIKNGNRNDRSWS